MNEIIEAEKIEIEQHVEFSEFENDMAKKIKNSKSIFIKGMTFRQRIATVIAFVLMKLGTDIKWQCGLFFYLLVTCVYSTYQFAKWIIHFFI